MTDALVPPVDPLSVTATGAGGLTAGAGDVVVETAVVSVVPVASGAPTVADPAVDASPFVLDASMVTGGPLVGQPASGLETRNAPSAPTPRPAVSGTAISATPLSPDTVPSRPPGRVATDPDAASTASDSAPDNPARPDPSGSARDAAAVADSDQHPGDQHPGDQHPGDQHPGDQHPGAKPIGPAPPIDAGDVLVAAADLVIGTAWWATGPIRAVGRLGVHAVEAGLAGATARSRRLQLRAQAHRGDARSTLDLLIQALLRPIIKRVVDAALAELDLTKIVLEHVDLDRVAEALDIDGIVAGVDLDAAVARVDLDAAVRRVDLDQIVGRIDVDGIVAIVDIDAVVDRVDIESIVNRLDLNEIAGRLDIDGIVAEVDLQAIVDRLDIAAVVSKVDPDPVVARVNFDAAMSQIDLIGIAQRVVDGIDLPGIIRESTGSLATEAVAGVRVQGQAADDAVGQLVGRVLRRRALDPPRQQ